MRIISAEKPFVYREGPLYMLVFEGLIRPEITCGSEPIIEVKEVICALWVRETLREVVDYYTKAYNIPDGIETDVAEKDGEWSLCWTWYETTI